MKKIYLFLVTLLIIPAALALFKPGFPETHDADWIAIRLSAFHQSLRDGHFPVRWSQRLNHGYGYPVHNFLYPLPLYVGEIFYLVCNNLTLAIKLIFIFSFIASGITMYLWLRQKNSWLPSLAGSLLYVYTPYRFVDTYVRGSVGESLGFVFIPLVFWGIDLLDKKPKLGMCLTAAAAAATILAHNTFVIFLILGLIYGLINLPKKRIVTLMLAFLLAASLSAYFWLPAILELKYVKLATLQVTDISQHLVDLKKLILPQWGYGPASKEAVDSLSFQLGLVNLIVLLLSLLILSRIKQKKQVVFFTCSFLLSIFLMHQLSQPIWKILPASTIIQFPWRLLSITTFASATLAALTTNYLKKWYPPALIVIFSLLLTTAYAKPKNLKQVPDSYFSTNESTTTTWNEYLPIWVNSPPEFRAQTRFQVVRGKAQINDFKETNIKKSFTVNAQEPSTISLASVFYPGWQVFINGSAIKLDKNLQNGMITFNILAGNSKVKVVFTQTPLRKTANIISLLGLFSIGLLSLRAAKLEFTAKKHEA